MQDAGRAGMQIVPTFDNFESEVDRGTRGPLTSAGRRGGKAYGDSAGHSIASSITSHIKSAIAIGGGLLAGAAVKNFLGDSISEARESQKVGALTVSTLRATGHEAGITNRQVGQLAHTLSHKAAIDDEQIQSAENVVLGMRGIRNEAGKGNDVFTKSIKRSVDLAAALAGKTGGTPNVAAAAGVVGKALVDPAKGLTRLTRAGVVFSAQQIANVKNLVVQGKTMEAQKIILHGLEERFAGAARSQATEGEKVGVAWKNVEEQVGTAILPLIDDIERAILTKGMPVFRHWAREFQDVGIPAIKDFADTVEKKGLPVLEHLYDKGKPLAEQIFPAISTTLSTTADALETAAPLAERMVKAFNNAPDWVKKGTVLAGLALYAGKKTGLLGAGTSALGGVISKSSPVPVFVTNPGFGAGGGGGGDIPLLGPDGKPGAHKGTPKGGKIGGAAGGAIASLLGLAPGLISAGDSGHETIDPKFATKASADAWLAAHPLVKPSANALTGKPPAWLTDPVNVHGSKGSIADFIFNGAHIKAHLDGYDDTKQQILNLRKLLAQPVTIPVHVAAGSIQAPGGDILDQHPNPATVGRGGGPLFTGDIHVQGDTYGRVLQGIQQRSQKAQLDGARSTAR